MALCSAVVGRVANLEVAHLHFIMLIAAMYYRKHGVLSVLFTLRDLKTEV
jgi:hypothetical protein